MMRGVRLAALHLLWCGVLLVAGPIAALALCVTFILSPLLDLLGGVLMRIEACMKGGGHAARD